MNSKTYQIKPGMSRFTDLFNVENEYAMDSDEKTKYERILESYKTDQHGIDISIETIQGYKIELLNQPDASEVYGILSPQLISIPVYRVLIEIDQIKG